MPSVSQSQQRYFGAIKGGSIPKPKGMSDKVVDEFAGTKRKGLPEHVPHMADGGTTSNTTFQQSEPVSKTARAAWMEKIPIRKPVEEKPVTAMADGGWMKKAFAHAGEPGHSLHASLNIPKDEKIPAGRLNAATHSKSAHLRHQAQAAKNAR